MFRVNSVFDVCVVVFLICLISLSGHQILAYLFYDWDYHVQTRVIGGIITVTLTCPLVLWLMIDVLRMTRLQHELAHRLAHDDLTGVSSRVALVNREKWLRKTAGVVLLMDIDHFKRVNDTLGHSKGDEVLREVGEKLRQNFRATDLIVRYGGEEFLLFFPGADPENAQYLCDRARLIVSRNVRVTMGNVAVPVTLSGGWVYKPAGAEISPLIDVADNALYRAKETGRNRVCPADMPYTKDTELRRA